jgi:hypothetical protein
MAANLAAWSVDMKVEMTVSTEAVMLVLMKDA